MMNANGKIKIIVIVGIVVVMMLAAGAAAYFVVIKPKMDGAPKKEKEVDWEKEFSIINIEDFTDLVITTSDQKYFQVTLAFEVKLADKTLPEELEMKKAMISEAIFQLLTTYTLDELASPEGQKAVKERLKNVINTKLTKGKINSVIFERFASQ
jgi:flagellar basal body-associated protein FliL